MNRYLGRLKKNQSNARKKKNFDWLIPFKRKRNSAEISRFLFGNTPKTLKFELLSFIRTTMEARASKKLPKWIQIGAHFGTFSGAREDTFSHRLLELVFDPKSWHRERQGCVQALERSRKRRAEVAMEVSKSVSQNR